MQREPPWGWVAPRTSIAAALPSAAARPPCPRGSESQGCPAVQCLFSPQQHFCKVRRMPRGLLRRADLCKPHAINTPFPPSSPYSLQGNPEQDTNTLRDFTRFPSCFCQHNHIRGFLLVCRSHLQLEAQITIYFLCDFLIWKRI